jgi:hypothetical protein
MLTRRMLLTPVTCPNVSEFTTVLIFEKYGVLKMLFAVSRKSSDRDSRITIVLFTDI